MIFTGIVNSNFILYELQDHLFGTLISSLLIVHDLRQLLGWRIRELRETARMSRADLAKFANVDPRQISNYKLCGAWPTPETLAGLLKGLGREDTRTFRLHRLAQTASTAPRIA
jgi:hypothetical protein